MQMKKLNIKQTIVFLLLFSGTFFSFAQVADISDNIPEENPLLKPLLEKKVDFYFMEALTQELLLNPSQASNLYEQVLKIDPKNHASMYRIGKIQYDAGNFLDAISYTKQAIELDSKNIWYYRQLADSYEAKGRIDLAIKTHETISKKFPKQIVDHFTLVELYFKNKNHEKALTQLNEIQSIQGFSAEIVERKKVIYIEQKNFEQAIVEMKQLCVFFPYETDYWEQLYELQIMAKKSDEALKTIQKIAEINNDNETINLKIAELYQSDGESEKALEYWKKAFESNEVSLKDKVNVLEDLLFFGDEDLEMKEQSEKLYTILEKKYPDEKDVLVLKAKIFKIESNTDSSLAYYNRILDSDAADAETWVQALNILHNQKKYTELYEKSESAMEFYPNNAEILFFKGESAFYSGEYDDAIYAYKKLVKINTLEANQMATCYRNLGLTYFFEQENILANDYIKKSLDFSISKEENSFYYIYFLAQTDKINEAKSLFNEVKKSDNTDQYLLAKAALELAQNKNTNAIETLNSIQNFTEIPFAYELLGDAYKKSGNAEKAKESWKKAYDLNLRSKSLVKKLK